MKHLDLVLLGLIGLAALIVGNEVERLALYSWGHENLSPLSALYFLSHNDETHLQTNLRGLGFYVIVLLAVRPYIEDAPDRTWLLGAILASWAATIITFVWIVPASPLGSQGLSIATSAMLGHVVLVVAVALLRHLAPRRIRIGAAGVAALGAAASLAAIGAVSDPAALLTTNRGALGHEIGFLSGLAGGWLYARSAASVLQSPAVKISATS